MPIACNGSRRGSYATLTILSFPIILGVGAIAIDLSYQRVVAAELQAATDLALLAGAQHLDGTSSGVTKAREAAIRAAGRNKAGGTTVALSSSDIEFGAWGTQGTMTAESDPEEVDAIRVNAEKGAIRSIFAKASFGKDYMTVRGKAGGQRGVSESAGAVSCYLPIAIPRCQFDNFTPGQLVDKTFKLNPAGVDNVGWGRAEGHPNASWVKSQISNCEGDGVARVGEDVGLNNGVISSALSELISEINSSTTTWDTEALGPLPARNSRSAISASKYGKVVEGPIIVFDGGPGYCTAAGPFNGYEEIVGFAWAVVYDVRTQGGATDKNIWVRLNPMADQELGMEGGGLVDAGTIYTAPPVRIE